MTRSLRFPSRLFRSATVALALVLALAGRTAAQTVFVWNGTGDWANPATWTPVGPPAATDTVQLASGAATVSDARSIGTLAFSGGSVGGAGILTIAGSGSTWSGGTFAGTGTTRIASTGTLTLSGSTNKTLLRGDGNSSGGRVLENFGTVTWTGTGGLLGGDGAVFVNRSGGTFDLQSDATLGFSGTGSTPTFLNAGLFKKSAGTGTSTVSSLGFTNNATVSVESGTLAFASGLASNAGTFTAATGTTILFSAEKSFQDGTIFSGPGTIRITAGTTTVGGNLSAGGLEFAGGTLLGSARVSGNLSWTGGLWSGTGTLTVADGATLSLSGAGAKTFNRNDGNSSGGRIVENLGNIVWSGTGSLLGGDGARIENRAGALFLVQNDALLNFSGTGSQPTFANAGTFRKTGSAGTTTISGTTFSHSGTVDVQSGTLSLASGIVSANGSFSAASGTTIAIAGGQSFAGTTTMSGAGEVRLVSGPTTVSGQVSASHLVFAGGTLQGSATVSGNLAWTGGTWSGNSTLTLAAGSALALSGDAPKTLNRGDGNSTGGRILENFGTATWSGTGSLLGGDGARVVNRSSGTFLVRNDASFSHNGTGSAPTFVNEGTLRKSDSTGTTTFSSSTLTNSGTVDVRTGTLALPGTVTSAGGTFSAAAGANLTFSGAKTFGDLTSLSGTAGNIRIAGGDTTVAGNLTFAGVEFAAGNLHGNAVVAGHLVWSAGTWTGNGTAAFAAGSTLTLSGAGDKVVRRGDGNSDGGRIVRSSGTVVWQDAGRIVGHDGAGFDLLSGSLFELRSAATYTFGGTGQIPFLTNAGTVRKTAGSGTTTFSNVVFTNTGRLELQGGSLLLEGGNTGSGLANSGTVDLQAGGTFHVADGAQLRYTGGTNTFSSVTLSGAGLVEVAGGTLDVSASTLSGRLQLSSGRIAGAGTFTVASGGRFIWSGGTLSGIGTLAIASGGQLAIDSAAVKSLDRADGNSSGGRTLANAGTATWSGTGRLNGGDGAAFQNLAGGVFDAQGDAVFGHSGTGLAPTFSNAGTVKKTAGTGVSEFALVFGNSGIVESASGTVRFTAGGSATGRFLASAGTIEFASSYTFETGARILGDQLVKLTAGTLVVAGNSSVGGIDTGNFALEGGTLSGAATLTIDSGGRMDWSGGALAGTGTLRIGAGGHLEIFNTVNHDFSRADGNSSGGRLVDNAGTVRWTAGNLRGGDGAAWINQSAGVLEIAGGGLFGHTGTGNQPTFSNSGTVRKTAGTVTTFSSVPVTTSGLVEVKSGELVFSTPVTANAGRFVADAGTTLTFSGGQTFHTGTSFAGSGLISATAGTTTFNGSLSADRFVLAGGTFAGTATVSGLFEWTGGSLSGNATFTVPSGSTFRIAGTGDRTLNRGDGNSTGGRILENFGTVTVTNSGNLSGNDGAAWINRAGATFDLRNDATISHGGAGSVPSFTNAGTFLKSSGTGTSTVSVPFVNTGTVGVLSGTLAFTSTFTHSGSAFVVAQGASLRLPGALDLGSASLAGTGTISAPAITARGVVAPGNSAGQLTLTGDLTLAGTSRLLIELGGATQGTGYDFLSVGGAATLGGTLQVSFISGYQWTLPADAAFTILTANSGLTGAFANIASGSRLGTHDGGASFLVTYGTGSALNSVVLSDFVVAVPEPSTYALLALGAATLFLTLRRRP